MQKIWQLFLPPIMASRFRKKPEKRTRQYKMYVAGPYTPFMDDEGKDHTENDNIATARKVATHLWEIGYTAICPHLNTAHFNQDCGCGWSDYLDGDTEIIKDCHGIYMLPFWQYSAGSHVELQVAKVLGLDIYKNITEV